MSPLTQILRANGINHPVTPLEADPSILTLLTHGEAAVAMWQKLRSLLERTSHYPIILGPRADALDFLSDHIQDCRDPVAHTLKHAATVDPIRWINDRRDMDPELFDDVQEGPWPARITPSASFVLPFDALTHRPHPEILVALVPTKNGCEAPAYLRTGNWNQCPEAGVHVAFASRWHRIYGAQLVGISHDTIEFAVDRPPATRETALVLAREQFMYCADIVEQGVGTISNLAATLLDAPRWFFWWD